MKIQPVKTQPIAKLKRVKRNDPQGEQAQEQNERKKPENQSGSPHIDEIV